MTQPASEPATPLLAAVLALLTPLLMTGDLAQADAAARQAIAAHAATGPDRLIGIAQTVGFALTALDNLRLSMPGDLSLSMKLKLRGNANALSRSAHRAAASLDSQPTAPPLAPTNGPQPDETPRILASLEDAQTQLRQAQTPGTATDRQIDLSWASAMTDVAAEFTAGLANLPPDQRRTQLRRIGALAETARALGRGEVPLKSRLLGTTSLRR